MPPSVFAASPDAPTRPWTTPRFFALLQQLGRLRVISQCGPSTFEALCDVSSFEIAHGFLNAITRDYHWHLALERCRHLRSHDALHARSGRRVLFFTLAESDASPPFLRIYLHREKGAEFDTEIESRFRQAHDELAPGRALTLESA